MFRGASAINLDTKGRIAIPKRYREPLHAEFNSQIVITVDFQSPCLLLYPFDEWSKIEAKLLLLSDTRATERAMKRLLLGYAHECELDGNGRILLPPPLRQYANLEKRAMLVGQLNKFELWDETAWQKQIEQSRETIQSEEFADNERLADFSL
ncbi:MraZ protein [Shewanella sediminis HAW-EB3]|uniref:Transcriptional regulator MraZ n=2 Tax=Shewanella TaxID=22 RepID=MRAZ_SHESH|nr:MULTISPECIES: division/cell wall cluster transcriptional repressor MraZ [Shewanella]A8FQ91.1 RecName: Full=Transcriptional regulator MraZ [Shewanella sediminis HAW-EB3]ABV35014.1 MraZ protein [Shewanella sediminis HAW-EB3]RTR36527.1 transcriptional regulator MraZ [Shewanella canadensis]